MPENITTGDTLHGFLLKEQRFIAEINAQCLQFIHPESGAKLFRIINQDPNKTFCIGFKTFPDSDNGAPHILEHSVLNGSKGFPVKSPFDVLLKGSLSTFLNAFTSKDFTMYPVASLNETDYFNLMHVYLDAVFRPLIYDDPRILKQEGWHHELTGETDSLRYTGVVYNEMKGAFSDPRRVLWYQVFRHLFPDNFYGYESGGTPEAITSLTEKEFLDFHRKFYHPENSYIFLYGNAALGKELEFIHENYLKFFTKTGFSPVITPHAPFDVMRDVTEYYPYLGEEPIRNQSFLTFNTVTGLNTDLQMTLALDLLCEALVNQESAPLRLALSKAGIGRDVSASSSNFYQHAVQIAAMNANPEDKEAFLTILRDTLEELVARGLDREELAGILNRMEFRLREGDDAQKGLMYLNMALPGWFFADDPFTGLEYDKVLNDIKDNFRGTYFEDLVRTCFLDNPHTLILTLSPSLTLDEERNNLTEAELKTFRDSLNHEEFEKLVRETEELIAYQQQADPPEALATIPMLSLSDLNKNAVFSPADYQLCGNIPLLTYPQFTNDVLYSGLMFDLQVVPREKLPWVSLLTTLLGSMDTTHRSFAALNKQLNLLTGGFYVMLRGYVDQYQEEQLIPKLVVSTKMMPAHVEKAMELVGEILLDTVYHDPERLKTVLMRHHSHLDARVKGSGYHVASHRFSSYISKQGVYRELTAGFDYYRFISRLVREFSDRRDEIMDELKSLSELIFTRQNLMFTASNESEKLFRFQQDLNNFSDRLPEKQSLIVPWELTLNPPNEGFKASSEVQFIVAGANYKELGFKWNGKFKVLSQILSTDWLQTKIRVIGGAYGGFSSISRHGSFTLSSYRDPNLGNTLETFRKTAGYLDKFYADEQTMTRYIIGTIADVDTLLTTQQKAERAFGKFISNQTAEQLQQEREEILSVTSQDIRNFAGLAEAVMNQNLWCIYGDSSRLESEPGLFRELISIGVES
jgi:Zn-dependent M16 (insulinase) family peptidase